MGLGAQHRPCPGGRSEPVIAPEREVAAPDVSAIRNDDVMNPHPWPYPGWEFPAVEAGDRSGNGNDRSPTGHDLRDHVEPVSLDRQIRLEDGGDEVAEAFGPLGGSKNVVVDVLVVRDQLLGDTLTVATHRRVHCLTHRQHQRSEMQRLSVARSCDAARHSSACGGEQQVLEPLDLLVERLYGREVPVDDETMHKER